MESPEAAVARALLTRAFVPSRTRIDSRTEEARLFDNWRVEPSRPRAGSPLDLDDSAFFSMVVTEHVSESPVLDHALFASMAAAENLTTVVRLIDDWDRNGRMRSLSVVTLCRSALESSSRAVWLLSPTERAERRDRASRMMKNEVLGQKKFLTKRVSGLASSGTHDTSEIDGLRSDLAHTVDVLDDLQSVSGAPTIEQQIEEASMWVDQTAVNPQHTSIADHAKSMYSIASGFAHGYTWTTRHMRGPTDIFNVTADFLYVATTMLSAAVVLHETLAAATADDISPLCPAHLRDTASRFHHLYA
ncbi:hypothetical protein [Rhodococcoides kroppenstedtii]|uniref:hypothetical protein n=1 Tax=Rhodococcoides kroppenstedtii TaxID=293050 RepID=UPI003638FC7D